METARETDEEHPGHRTANEEVGSIVLHVGHDMDERKKTAISNEEACREGEATLEYKREETNGMQTENVIETECLGEELSEHCTRTDEEAGSIVLHVGHDMNEKEKKMKKRVKQQQQKRHINPMRRSQRKTCRRLIEERRTTPKEEKQLLKVVGKQIKNASGTKKERKDRKSFNEYSNTSKGSRTSQESNLLKEECSSPR